MPAEIKSIIENSIAQRCGLESEDTLISINGDEIKDILDYKFYSSSPYCELLIEKKDGRRKLIKVENEDYEDLGIIFKNPLIDKMRRCSNKCIFCFIDQLPKNMRKTMYFKDDDYRLSVFYGNYITLTNVTDEEINKIIKMRLPRINVSVHTTNSSLRCYMLNNKNAGNIMQRLKKMADANISLNAQIVLCPNINDGKELDNTLSDLSSLYPAIKSISVVPVGLTKHRANLPKVQKFDKISAIKVISQVESWQQKFKNKYGRKIVFAADDFYMLTNTPIPSYESYEEFLQIENGVGLVRELSYEFDKALSNASIPHKTTPKSLATGVLAADFIMSLTKKVDKNINVYPIINDFFGHDITVAGLVTGKDLINQLKGKDLGSYLLLPSVMLRDNTFLDDVTVKDIESKLSIKVVIVEIEGNDLLQKLLL